MTLFSQRDRTDTSPRAHGETQHAFYDRVGGAFWDDVRDLVESWFSRVDQTDQLDLGGRLRSDDDRQFNGAFHELYLHESLLRMGYTLTIHPTLPNSDRHVDFLAEKGQRAFYLEAGSARPSDVATASSARMGQVYEFLNKMDSPNFRFAVKLVQHSKHPLKPGPLRNKVREWIETLNPDDCLLSDSVRLAELPQLSYEDSGWLLELTAMGRPPWQRGDSAVRNVRMTEDDQVWTDEGGIAKTLKAKGRAYGELDAPFVVAVATGSMGVTDGDIAALLYGNGHWDSDGSGGAQLKQRQPNGYWKAGSHSKHRGVSAVLVVPLLRPATIAAQQHTIWEHPDPEIKVDELSLWRRAIYDNGMPTFIDPERTQADWFDLDDDWPTGDPYPPRVR
ncbi:hypothetical protein [Nocardioides alcanivorans]|uniref:hypothetical protein n=1 Tax=Nocardioides alcanivorans TaxID=2897352 RepID=UPI001F452993|nr:hypothetical protein [Nocardioides alcanivorans]